MSTINRADFVKLSALFGGSLVLGATALGTVNASAQAASLATDSFKPNMWLIIHADNRATVFVSKSEMGQGVATGLPTIVADELDLPFENVDIEFAPAEDRYKDPSFSGSVQITGGSQSIMAMWMPLRTAGASARAMLVEAAAKQWGVDASALHTKNGHVIDPHGDRIASYGSLVEQAAKLDVPKHPKLKTPAEFTLIGKQNARVDTPLKVTGRAKFGIDVRVPGMKFASVLRPPVFGAKVRSFDASKAKQVKGVIDVVEIPSGIAVVAENSWAAFQGKAALHVTYDEGSFAAVSTPEIFARMEKLAHSREGAIEFVKRGSMSVPGSVHEATYRGPAVAHAAMEPMNATASVTEHGVEIWAPTQVQTFARASAAKIAGVPLENVTVHTTYLGGGFGRRLYTDFTDDAVAVSKAIKAPVQVIWQREDDTKHDWYKPMSVNAIRGVLSHDGELLAVEHTVVMDSILKPLDAAFMQGDIDQISLDSAINTQYEFPNYHGYWIDPHTGIPAGSLRAPGANWNTFVIETFLDELAHHAGKDPIAFRMPLLKSHPRSQRVLRRVAQNAAWGAPAPGTKQGVAFGFWNGTAAAAIAEVSLVDKMPKVHRVFVVADIGTAVNPSIIKQQMEGGTQYGLSMALSSKITVKNGAVEQSNFYDFIVSRLAEAPHVHADIIAEGDAPSGIGEIACAIVAPAVANALFRITGKPVRTQPFSDALA